jgi:hypothetical protein
MNLIDEDKKRNEILFTFQKALQYTRLVAETFIYVYTKNGDGGERMINVLESGFIYGALSPHECVTVLSPHECITVLSPHECITVVP